MKFLIEEFLILEFSVSKPSSFTMSNYNPNVRALSSLGVLSIFESRVLEFSRFSNPEFWSSLGSRVSSSRVLEFSRF